MMRILTRIALLILGILIIIASYLAMISYRFLTTPLLAHQPTSPMTIKLSSGMGARQLIDLLKHRQLVNHPRLMLMLIHLKNATTKLQAGEYAITRQMTPGQLLDHIIQGKVVNRSFTIIEGWTFRQLRQALSHDTHIKHVILSLNNSQLLNKLGATYKSPEGLFFPDTYYYTWGESDLTLLRKAYQQMQTQLKQQWQACDTDLPYKSTYKVLIVASLIEKETALNSERRLIAGVIVNRLRKNMPLQIDPTVLYGLGRSYRSHISRDDLTLYTPYNTYTRYGLPPTPIDMPSLASIMAACHPQATPFFYYVARGDGSHQFSVTYQQQKAAVRKYILQPKQAQP